MDGHVIWGPYKHNGAYFLGSDVDSCNGGLFDGVNYGYATTEFFPYFVGCWGPGDSSTTFCQTTID